MLPLVAGLMIVFYIVVAPDRECRCAVCREPLPDYELPPGTHAGGFVRAPTFSIAEVERAGAA